MLTDIPYCEQLSHPLELFLPFLNTISTGQIAASQLAVPKGRETEHPQFISQPLPHPGGQGQVHDLGPTNLMHPQETLTQNRFIQGRRSRGVNFPGSRVASRLWFCGWQPWRPVSEPELHDHAEARSPEGPAPRCARESVLDTQPESVSLRLQ